MSFSEPGTEKPPKNTQTEPDVSKTAKNHIDANIGRPIAVIEVAPRDSSFMSLGTYKNTDQPKGFCIEYSSNVETPEKDVHAEITTRKFSGGFQYLLTVVNDSDKIVNIGVSVF